MPVYEYIARNQSNEVIKGSINAINLTDVRTKLKTSGYLVTSVKEKLSGGIKATALTNTRVSPKELVSFCQNLATMLDAGISIVESLNIIGKQMQNSRMRKVILELRKEIEIGSTLAAGMARFPNIFPDLTTNLVKAGEEGGFLVESLRRIVIYVEREEEIKSRVKAALIYPTIVLSIAALIVTFILAFVMPRFAAFYKSFGGTLPLPTLMMLALSSYIRNFWLFLYFFVLV